jgi:hypothetical protein
MTSMVRFRELRKHVDLWQAVNDSIMAFLVGSHLASHTLQLTEGSDRMLPEIFPGVAHIERFNIRTSLARNILSEAEKNLALMAIPQVMAIHEDFIMNCLRLLAKFTLCSNVKLKNASPKTMHKTVETCTGQQYRPQTLEQFELLRCVRNCMIHSGGVANDEFDRAIESMSDAARSEWVRRTTRSPDSLVDGERRLDIQHYEIVSTLAITKKLWRETNMILCSKLTTTQWLEVALDDILQDGPLAGNPQQKIRRFEGFMRFHYNATKPDNIEISKFLKEKGLLE